jgi:hypothetical protein
VLYPGLTIDFLLLAERVAEHDKVRHMFSPDLTYKDVIEKYPPVQKVKEREANTLTLQVPAGKKQVKLGIRRTQEIVTALFHALQRTKYPSSYVYNIGMWNKFTDVIEKSFQLSSLARRETVRKVCELALSKYQRNVFFVRRSGRIPIFMDILAEYPVRGKDENARRRRVRVQKV